MPENLKSPIERITDAVCDVLAEQGIAGLSMRNVAAKADATIGLITHHFPNRAAMVKAAVRATWLKEQSIVVWPEQPDKAAILRAIKVFLPLDEVRHRQLSVWVAFWALTQNDEDLQEIHVGVHRSIRDEHVKWLTALGLELESARKYADRLCLFCDGLLLYALLDPAYWTQERQLGAVRGMIDDIFAAASAKT